MQDICKQCFNISVQVCVFTQPHTAVLQEVAQVFKHGFLILTADSTEVTEETAATGHHFGESNLLQKDLKKKKNFFVTLYTAGGVHPPYVK